MGIGSGWHLLIVLVIVLLLFGNRLPSVMRNLGRGVTEFKKGIEGIGGEAHEEAKPKTDRIEGEATGETKAEVKAEVKTEAKQA